MRHSRPVLVLALALAMGSSTALRRRC